MSSWKLTCFTLASLGKYFNLNPKVIILSGLIDWRVTNLFIILGPDQQNLGDCPTVCVVISKPHSERRQNQADTGGSPSPDMGVDLRS